MRKKVERQYLMNACIISGLPTNNKYKNQYIHKDVLGAAKTLMEEEKCTMPDALRYISLALTESTIQRLEQGDIPE